MVPIDVIVSQGTRELKRKDIEWQRLIMSTGQTNYLSQENQIEAFKLENQKQVDRQKCLMDMKLKIELGLPVCEAPLNDEDISVAHARIYKEQRVDYLGV